ncbi:MAG: SPOR domain-containing protein [Armatimonadota bacterium]
MKAQTAHRGFPTALLTFSVMLLVLAIGFVVGRLVVARAYLGAAPKIEAQGGGGSELDENRAAPGRIYVPSPASARPEEEGRERRPEEERGAETEPGTEPDLPAGQETAAPGAPEAPAAAATDRARPESEAAETEQRAPAEEGSKTYAIQVGVFSSRQGARQVVDDLARAGYPARISPDRRGGEELYRVVTGRYRSEYAARKALEQLRGEGFEAFLIEQ